MEAAEDQQIQQLGQELDDEGSTDTIALRKFLHLDFFAVPGLDFLHLFLQYNFHPLYKVKNVEPEKLLLLEKSMEFTKLEPKHLQQLHNVVPTVELLEHGYIFKFGSKVCMKSPLEIVDPSVLVVLYGSFNIRVHDELTPALTLGKSQGVFLNEGDALQVENLEAEFSYFLLLEIGKRKQEATPVAPVVSSGSLVKRYYQRVNESKKCIVN